MSRHRVGRCLHVILVLAAVAPGCALKRSAVPDHGIPFCPPGAERDVLSSDALQCWFDSRHGWWRVLGHQSHLQALVVEVDARDLRDAGDIAQRVVGSRSASAYTEVLVYVQRLVSGDEARVARVRWTPGAGFETVAFSMRVGGPQAPRQRGIAVGALRSIRSMSVFRPKISTPRFVAT